MDLTKSIEYFDPVNVRGKCHIIGCGSVGSTIAENLARLGVTKFVLYDFDIVEPHNLANQMFIESDIKSLKVEAVSRILNEINPEVKQDIQIFAEGWKPGMRLSGYVFLCVDSIDVRKQIVKENLYNKSVLAMFDFRTRLEDAQHYAADWNDKKMVENLVASMDFTHEEAAEATPVSACNIPLGVAPTVRIVANYGVANFMNFIRGKGLKKMIFTDIFNFDIDVY